MLKTVIVEDEINVREGLKKMLSLIDPSISIVGEVGFVKEAIKIIAQEKPDVIFLDIQLEDGTGFDVLKAIRDIDVKIIFTTAFNHFAIKAFKYSAIDYLLKPIDPVELQNAIERAKKEISKDLSYKKALQVLENNIEKKDLKIVLKTTEQRHVINVKDIIRLEADGAYTKFVLEDKTVMVSKNISYYQELLDERFIRCHQSHLVNKSFVQSFKKSNFLELDNGELISVSIRKIAEVNAILNAINEK